MGRGSQSPAQLKRGASRLLPFSDSFLSLPFTVAFLAPFHGAQLPSAEKTWNWVLISHWRQGSKALQGLPRGRIFIQQCWSCDLSHGAWTGVGIWVAVWCRGRAVSVVSSSAASDGTPGLRAAPLGTALSHGLRNRKGAVEWLFQTKGKPSSSLSHPEQKSCPYCC